MKNTPLTEVHQTLGARMADFAGYNMPIVYSNIKEEHLTVRNTVGMFDVSHMGEFFVSGKDALAFLQKVTSNDVSKLSKGKAQYSCFPNNDGGIIDDLLVYDLGEGEYMLVVNASNITKDWQWLQENAEGFEIAIENRSEQIGLLAVQGPKAVQALQSLTDVALEDIKFYHFTRGKLAGVEMIISATGYTGAGGFELYTPADKTLEVWKAVLAAGADFGIAPIGLGARDTLRLEMGYCLYGNDIDDTTSPLEAGLGWITKLKKGDFNSSDIFKQQKSEGLSKKLVAFVLEDRRVPRQGYAIVDEQDNVIGKVTSGTQSPSLDQAIGLGYVTIDNAAIGSSIFIKMRNKSMAAKIVKLPFYEGK